MLFVYVRLRDALGYWIPKTFACRVVVTIELISFLPASLFYELTDAYSN